MMKKTYIAPVQDVCNLETTTSILAGSWGMNGQFDGDLGGAHSREIESDPSWLLENI